MEVLLLLSHAGQAPVSDAIVDPDLALLDRARGGERAAFDQLIRRHQRGVWRLARRYVRADADAADVTQLAFVRAYRSVGQFRGAASVRSWLYRIAINCALTWLRDHRRDATRAAIEDDDGVPVDARLVEPGDGAGRLIEGEQRARLRAAIARLPPRQRLVLELRVFDDLSFREVAEAAACTENTAKVNFHHAVKRLRELLGGDDGR